MGRKLSPYDVTLSNEQRGVKIPRRELTHLARTLLIDEHLAAATVNIALVDNPHIHAINLEYLQHDFPTDVISFVLEAERPADITEAAAQRPRRRGRELRLEGTVIIGAEYAAEMAGEYGWSIAEELSLYLVHGLLHLCGYDDLSPPEKRIMRRREREVLALVGITPKYRQRKPRRG